jgi:hypothetical protein
MDESMDDFMGRSSSMGELPLKQAATARRQNAEVSSD